MKHFSKVKNIVSGLTLGVAVVAFSSAGALAAPASSPQVDRAPVSGPQAKPPVEAGKVDAAKTQSLGSTKLVKTDASGKPAGFTAFAGNVSGVDFSSFYNYCYKQLAYTTVYNSTAATKYIRVVVYNNGVSYDYYTSVAAGGSYSYPAFYGVEGNYYAYLYVWNGSSYAYDEYKASNNTCNVQVTRTYNSGGWVQLKIQNYGTAYATQVSSELAPYPGSGTYTGTHYDYPAAGGAAIYRWFQVGTSPYAIVSHTSGSYLTPKYFTGDL